MAGKFQDMKDHVIVCGYGTVGQKTVDVLAENNVPFIIIDSDQKKVDRAHELGYKTINGDATLSKTLKDASVEAAKAIAIVMDNDAKNLFAVLTAKDLNKGIFVATRANDDFIREKLIEAGADYIVMPHKSASKEIVKELFK